MELTLIQLRRGTAAEWTSENPVLGDGEPGVESDTGRLKIGTGVNPWASLGYVDQTAVTAAGSAEAAATQAATAALQAAASAAAAEAAAEEGGGSGGGGPITINGVTATTFTLAASDVGAKPASYVPAWVDVTGKPATFPPAAHSHTIADMPAGTTVTVVKSGGVWPPRPTARGDVVVRWKGPDPSPAIVSSGTGGMRDDTGGAIGDVREVTP